jgi:hypothetical protein
MDFERRNFLNSHHLIVFASLQLAEIGDDWGMNG